MSNELAVLRTAKAALLEGFITDGDFDIIKAAFLRAQQIKAGLDAGFITEADYKQVKSEFIHSLDRLSMTPSQQQQQQQQQQQAGYAPDSHPQHRHTSSNGADAVHPASQPGYTSTFNPPASAAAPPASFIPSAAAAPSAAPAQRDYQRQPSQTQAPPRDYQRLPSLTQTPAAPAAPSSQPAQAAEPGRFDPPADIPRMGGARPKQSSGTSMSGISVSEESVNLYYYLKAKSTYRWATWKINDAGNQVVIANVGDKDATYSDLLSVLPASDCRFAVFDYQFTNSEGCLFNKIVFINWAPDTAQTRKKMMYASTKDFFKGHLDGLSIEMMGSDMDDLAERDVGDAVRASVTRQ